MENETKIKKIIVYLVLFFGVIILTAAIVGIWFYVTVVKFVPTPEDYQSFQPQIQEQIPEELPIDDIPPIELPPPKDNCCIENSIPSIEQPPPEDNG